MTKTRYKKSIASRQQVLDAAMVTIASKGFAQTSVQDIADAARLSKGAVHYHFESKDDLIQCLLTQCCEAIIGRMRAAWASPGTPFERIGHIFFEMWTARRDGAPEYRVISDLMSQALHDVRLRAPLATMLTANRRQIIDGLAQAGMKPKVPVDVLPRLLLATLDGLALHAVFDPLSSQDEADVLLGLQAIAQSLFEV